MLSSIIVWLEKYSVESVITLVILSVLYATWTAYIRYFFKSIYTKKQNTKNSKVKEQEELEKKKEQLETREFFPNLKFKINVDISTEEFSSDVVKRCLYKDILTILFESYYTNTIDFVKNLDVSWNTSEWASKLNDVNYKIIEEFKANAARQEIPKVVILAFNDWYSLYRKQIYYYIKKITQMNDKDAVEDTNTYLLILELILMNVLADMKNFSSFDDDFRGVEYKGKIIGQEN